MANQLIQIVSAVAVPAGGSVAIPHNINNLGVAYIPDEVDVDNGDFTVTLVTSTAITVRNDSLVLASCNVLLKLWHSITRVLGANTTSGNFTGGLTPRPFISAASGGGGSGAFEQRFTYTAAGGEGPGAVTVTLPAVRGTTNYIVIGTLGNVALNFVPNVPSVGKALATFTFVPGIVLTAADTIDFYVAERT